MAFPSSMDLTQLEERTKIQWLSSVINLLKPPSIPLLLRDPPRTSADSQAYHHIATLLTRGVKRGSCGHGSVAVTGQTTSSDPLSITVVTSEPVTLDSESHPRHVGLGFCAKRIKPSSKSFEALADDPRLTTDIAFDDHAADMFNILKSLLGPQDLQQPLRLSQIIILRRCFPKFRAQVLGIDAIFGNDLISRLEAWVPEGKEILDEKQIFHFRNTTFTGHQAWIDITSSSTASLFIDAGIQRNSHNKFCLSIDNAAKWVKVLLDRFHRLQQLVRNYKDNLDVYGKIVDELAHLHFLVHNLRNSFSAIFNCRSFYRLLEDARTSLTPSVLLVIDLSEDEITELRNEFMCETSSEKPHEQLLRYFQGIVRWTNALLCLNHRLSRKTDFDPVLNIIHIPIPLSTSTIPVHPLLREVSKYVYPPQVPEDYRESVLKQLRTARGLPLPETLKFSPLGTIHCEASLMGLFYASSSADGANHLPKVLSNLVKESNRVIGTDVKCCWTCDYLAGSLSTSLDPPAIQLLGTTAMVLPWTAPCGIPDEVLKKVSSELMTYLIMILKGHLWEVKEVEMARAAKRRTRLLVARARRAQLERDRQKDSNACEDSS